MKFQSFDLGLLSKKISKNSQSPIKRHHLCWFDLYIVYQAFFESLLAKPPPKMSVNAFAVRQRAAEGHWFNTEDRLAIVRRLERMVESVSYMNFLEFFLSLVPSNCMTQCAPKGSGPRRHRIVDMLLKICLINYSKILEFFFVAGKTR